MLLDLAMTLGHHQPPYFLNILLSLGFLTLQLLNLPPRPLADFSSQLMDSSFCSTPICDCSSGFFLLCLESVGRGRLKTGYLTQFNYYLYDNDSPSSQPKSKCLPDISALCPQVAHILYIQSQIHLTPKSVFSLSLTQVRSVATFLNLPSPLPVTSSPSLTPHLSNS